MTRPLRRMLALAGTLVLCDAMSHLTVAQISGETCDRECLTGFLDDYLAALAAGDVSALRVTPDARFTENGRELDPEERARRSPVTLLAYRDDLIDPVNGGAATLTAFREDGRDLLLFVRLAVVDRELTEVETIVVREGDVRWFDAANLERLSDVFMSPAPSTERSSRAELVAGARAYLTAVATEGTPDFVQAPFAPGLKRFENGLQTTNAAPESARLDRHTWSADLQLERGVYAGTRVTDIRYPVIDIERGSVLAIPLFHFPGENAPTVLAAEIFKITGGRLREIRAILQNVPADAGPGWPVTPTYVVRRASAPVSVDGVLDDRAWSEAWPAVSLQFLWENQTGARQLTHVQMLWDTSALYIAYRAEDSDITARFLQRDDPTFLDDAVEIFINPAPAQDTLYYGFEMNARGVLYDYLNFESRTLFKRFDSTAVEIGVSLDGTLNDSEDVDRGWSLEVAIPWENFERLSSRRGGVPAAGDAWAANINRWDGVEPDRRMSIWSDPMNDESWPHVPARFGTLLFAD